MESQMEIFFERIKLEMEKQTNTITNNLMTTMDSKLAPLIEENLKMKSTIEKLQKKVDFLENERRKNNLVVYGLKEEERSVLELLSAFKNTIKDELNIEIYDQEITKIHRLGRTKGKAPRPLLISFGNHWKRLEILRNKKMFKTISISEDFSKDILEKRKALKGELAKEREKGNYAYIKGGTLVVKSNANTEKRKRESTVSPIDPKDKKDTVTTTPQTKFSKVNAFDLMRQMSAPNARKNTY